MEDFDMMAAVDKAIGQNSTKHWLKHFKNVSEQANKMSAQRFSESMKMNGDGQILPDNFDWSEGGTQPDEISVPTGNGGKVGNGNYGMDTSTAATPAMSPYDSNNGDDEDDGDDNGDSPVEIDYEEGRGIRITVGGKTGYIPDTQIPELIDFAQSLCRNGGCEGEDETDDNNDDDGDYDDGGEDEEDEEEDGSHQPNDFSSFLENM